MTEKELAVLMAKWFAEQSKRHGDYCSYGPDEGEDEDRVCIDGTYDLEKLAQVIKTNWVS